MSSQQEPFITQKKQVDVFCPIHGNWIGHYDYGSVGSYYCWCKKCKKEIKIVMEGKMKSELIKSRDILLNEGQIDGVPANSRLITSDKMEALKRSIKHLPDMLSMRELLVYPLNGKYVVLGGNMRYRACVDLGYNEIPCKIIPETTPPDKLRAIVMQDNNSYGDTDWDMIANEWDIDELRGWSMELVKSAIDYVKNIGIECETFGNDNSNGNALYQIVKQWEERKK